MEIKAQEKDIEMIRKLMCAAVSMLSGERDAAPAKPRRGLPFGGRLAVAALIALSAMNSFANPTSVAEWYANVEESDTSQSFVVKWHDGKLDKIVSESINPEDIVTYHWQKPSWEDWPDNEIARGAFPGLSGVELVQYAGVPVWTLRMSGNVVIDGYEIQANRSFAIELTPGTSVNIRAPDPYTNSGRTTNTVYGICCDHGILIYGNGTLSVSHRGTKGDGIRASYGDLLITGGASVHVQTDGVLAIGAGPLGFGTGGSLSVIGALLETTGGGIWSYGDILLDRAVVNILSLSEYFSASSSTAGGVNAWGNLTIDRSFCTSIAKSAWALYARKVFWPHDSIVYAMSEKDTCVKVAYNADHEPSVIGKGLYKFVSLGGDGESAIDFNYSMSFNGGELVTCAPGGYGMHSVLYDFTVNSGLIRNQYSMNPKNEFFVSRELMDAYGIISGWESLGYGTAFDPYDAIELFLGQTMPGWIAAQGIETPSGDAYAAIATASFCLNGGTILTEASEMGVIVNDGYSGGYYWEPTVKGGSLLGPIGYYEKIGHGYNEMCAVSEQTNTRNADGIPEYALVCVTNIVAGEPYSHVTSGWTAQLPDGYDTSSLYLDGENKLYFWVPEEYAKSGSGSGSGSGGRSGRGGSDSSTGYYSVTLDFNGGSGGIGSDFLRIQVKSGEAIGDLPAPTRAGYSFDGWWTGRSGGTRVTAETRVTRSVTYYAHWQEKGSNGGNSSGGGSGGVSVVGGRFPDMTFAKTQVVTGALYKNGNLVGSVQVKAGKINARKDTANLSVVATVLTDGKVKKVTVRAVLRSASQARSARHRGTFSFKAPLGAMTFVLDTDGSFSLTNDSYSMGKATVGGALKSGSRGTFRLNGFNLAVPGEVLRSLLPYEESFGIAGTRWQFAKTTAAKWAKDRSTGEFVLVADSDNPSSLKLTYTAKTGIFKGTFKAYALEDVAGDKKKLQKYTVNVIGIVTDGKGQGEAYCRRPAAGPWSVTVE